MAEKINFTKDAIKNLTPREDGKRREVWDIKVGGLLVQITPSGGKTFYLRKRSKGGAPERICLGKFPDMTIDQARTHAMKLLSEFAAGRNPARDEDGGMTIGGLFKRYMDYHGKNVARPDAIQSTYGHYLSQWDKQKCEWLTYQKVDAWHKKLPEKISKARNGKFSGERTANRALTLLHAMFQMAIKKRWYKGENPAYGIERFQETNRDRFISADELPRFFDAVLEEPSDDVRDYVLISVLTGARKSKVLSMQWRDINLDEGFWVIPQDRNEKNTATAPLIDEVKQLLRIRKENNPASDFVFSARSKSGHMENPRSGWLRILERAGLNDLRIHDLRRTLGSWQAKTGASLSIIGKSLGHTSQQATAIYAQLDLEPVRQSVEKATSAILAAARVTKK